MINVRRPLAVAVVAVTSAVVVTGVATPAQAWSYCTGTVQAGFLTLFDNQGYCTAAYAYWPDSQLSPGQCISFTGYFYNNWAGSVANKSSKGLIFSDSANCTGAASFALPAGNTDPDLYSGQNLGNKVSSVYVV